MIQGRVMDKILSTWNLLENQYADKANAFHKQDELWSYDEIVALVAKLSVLWEVVEVSPLDIDSAIRGMACVMDNIKTDESKKDRETYELVREFLAKHATKMFNEMIKSMKI